MSAVLPASLHLDAGKGFRGGQRQVLYLLQGLAARGARVQLCCPKSSPLHARARAAGIPVEPLTMRSGFDFPSAVRLARIVRGGDFDLVHAHDSHSHSIALAARGIRHEPALGQRLFVTRRSIGQDRGKLGRIKYGAEGIAFIAISKQVRDALVQQGVAPERIAIVPSGVDVERLAGIRDDPRPDPWGLRARGRRVVGTIGALTREKNPMLLVEAFRKLLRQIPNVHLLLVGDGALRRRLERKVDGAGLQNDVTFAGHLDDVTEALRVLEVFALSSDTEGLCTAVLDAMAAGVPVVTTAAGGVLSIARHGETALVVPPGDAETLAASMTRVLLQPDLAQQLVDGARRVAAAHSIDAMVEGTLQAYATLAGVAAPRTGTP